MDFIVLNEGMYHLIPVTKTLFAGAMIPEVIDCYSLCEILRESLTTYFPDINKYVMKDGSGLFYGCICE